MSHGRFNGLRAAVEVWVKTPASGLGAEAFNALGRDMLAALEDRDRVREAATKALEAYRTEHSVKWKAAESDTYGGPACKDAEADTDVAMTELGRVLS